MMEGRFQVHFDVLYTWNRDVCCLFYHMFDLVHVICNTNISQCARAMLATQGAGDSCSLMMPVSFIFSILWN